MFLLCSSANTSIPPAQMDPSLDLYDDFENEVTPDAVRAEMTAEMSRLRDEVEELRASLSASRPGSAVPAGNRAVPPNMQLVNGMMLRRSARSESEIGAASIALSRFSRGGKDEADKRKIRDRCCAALKNKFVLLDYAKLTNSATSRADLGAMVLAQTNALQDLKDWAERYDVHYLLHVPDVPSFAILPGAVASARKVDLLSEYRSFSLSSVLAYQEFVATWMADVDTESSQWLLEVLKASTSKAILAELQQEYMALPKSQRGGLTLFKMIMDIVHTNTTEHIELFRSYLNTYQLRDTAGEEVPTSVAGFVAVVLMLAENDRPSNLVQLLLNGLESSNKRFNDTVAAQRGVLNTPMYEHYKQNESELSLLLKFTGIVKKVYYSELQAKNWQPSQPSGHLFPAVANTLTPAAVLAKQSHSLPPGYANHSEKFVKWYLSRQCSICRGNHPDKFHDDPDMITRPFKKVARPQDSKRPIAHKSSVKYKPGKKEEFKKRVYQVATECLEDFTVPDDAGHEDANDDFALLADDVDDGQEPDTAGDGGDDSYEDSALALAALALQGLSIN